MKNDIIAIDVSEEYVHHVDRLLERSKLEIYKINNNIFNPVIIMKKVSVFRKFIICFLLGYFLTLLYMYVIMIS